MRADHQSRISSSNAMPTGWPSSVEEAVAGLPYVSSIQLGRFPVEVSLTTPGTYCG